MNLLNNLQFFFLKINYKNLRILKNKKKRLNIFSKSVLYTNQIIQIFDNLNSFGLNNKYYLKILCLKYGFSLFIQIGFIRKNLLKIIYQKFRFFFINIYLKQLIKKKLNFKKKLGLYQFQRQSRFLPSRGQRTQTNARTIKKFNFFNK